MGAAERKGFGILDDQYLRRDGGNSMEGPLRLQGDPATENEAATKAYTDRERLAADAQAQTLVTQLQTLLDAGLLDSRYLNRVEMPGLYQRDAEDPWTTAGVFTAADRFTLRTPAGLSLDIAGDVYFIRNSYDMPLSDPNAWDTLATNYTIAANRAGVTFYIYACVPPSGTGPLIVLSDNNIVPVGYTPANSRRIGGFHGLCVAVGAIGGHPLTNFVAGDILPDSVWDEIHRPTCEPAGMVYSPAAGIWVDIYLPSGTGTSTSSVYNNPISDTRDWMDFVDDGGAVGKRMLHDGEFQLIGEGSNEETNIFGGAAPPNAGGHIDTASRRMISDIGVEDCCGAQHQWLAEQTYGLSSTDHAHTSTIDHKAVPAGAAISKVQAEAFLEGNLGSGADENINSNNTDPTPAWVLLNLPGAKGSLWRQGTLGDAKVIAGGMWNSGVNAGSRARYLDIPRDTASAQITARFGCARR